MKLISTLCIDKDLSLKSFVSHFKESKAFEYFIETLRTIQTSMVAITLPVVVRTIVPSQHHWRIQMHQYLICTLETVGVRPKRLTEGSFVMCPQHSHLELTASLKLHKKKINNNKVIRVNENFSWTLLRIIFSDPLTVQKSMKLQFLLSSH